MKRSYLAFLLLLLIPISSAHAQKRAFTIEDNYRLRSISDIHLSPDGKSVIYAVGTSDLPRGKRVSHVWLVDIDGRNVHQLRQNEKGESSPLFSPDGKWISFIGSEDGNSNLYLMP